VWKAIFGTVGNVEMNAQSLPHPAVTGHHHGRSAALQLHTVWSERCTYLFKITTSKPLVHEAENDPTELSNTKSCLPSKIQWENSSVIIELGIVSADLHSSKYPTHQNKTVSTKTKWKGSHP